MPDVQIPRDSMKVLQIYLRSLADDAYARSIDIALTYEASGWEAKVKAGEFGRKELDAYVAMGEQVGQHRAFMKACQLIDELLQKQEEPCPVSKRK